MQMQNKTQIRRHKITLQISFQISLQQPENDKDPHFTHPMVLMFPYVTQNSMRPRVVDAAIETSTHGTVHFAADNPRVMCTLYSCAKSLGHPGVLR